MNGPKDGATSASTSSPAAASPSLTTPNPRSEATTCPHSQPETRTKEHAPLHHYPGLDRAKPTIVLETSGCVLDDVSEATASDRDGSTMSSPLTASRRTPRPTTQPH